MGGYMLPSLAQIPTIRARHGRVIPDPPYCSSSPFSVPSAHCLVGGAPSGMGLPKEVVPPGMRLPYGPLGFELMLRAAMRGHAVFTVSRQQGYFAAHVGGGLNSDPYSSLGREAPSVRG